MYVLANGWFMTLIRQFFFSIDKIVFNFISQIYDLLITIARTSILSQADILNMAERIYSLLTVFMIFKVTLSLITYVVNPDDFSDKSKGVSKLGVNIIISLGLLILTPYMFKYAYELQTIILEDNSLATLVFGDKAQDGFITSAGDDIAFITMSPFFTPNVSITELSECIELTQKKDEKIVFNTKCSGLGEGPEYKEPSNEEGITEEGMLKLIKQKNSGAEVKDLQNYVAGVENNSLGLMFREEMVIAQNGKKGDYIMDYKFVFSTVVGVVVCLLLITFCMDVGVRSIKLAFLQLIAPVPILSYVDPKSGKDGLFKKWYSMCFKTYLSLFIRLLTIYFAVYIISLVADMQLVDIIDGSYVTSKLVAIFIIIGALMFAKQLPKILEGLGIKLDGDGKFTLNPLRKMEKEMAGGGLLKKPNDALGKFAKGGFGMGTLAKKTISGANAAYHGKGFSNGFNRYKGGVGKWIDKQREAYLPYGYEASKKKKEGRENLKYKDRLYSKGEDLEAKYGGQKGGIANAFTNNEYRKSYEAVGAQKKNMYNWQHEVENRRADLNAAQSNLVNVQSNPKSTKEEIEKAKERVKIAESNLSNAMTQSGKAQSQYELTKSKHDDMKKIYTADAEIEDAHDFYMKNSGKSADNLTDDYYDNKNKQNNEQQGSDEQVSESDLVNDTIQSHYVPESGSTTQEIIENNTGVNRESTVEMGAYDPENSALADFFENNTSEEEKRKRIEIENKITSINAQIENLRKQREKVTDGDSYMELTRKIQTLTKELEDLRRKL